MAHLLVECKTTLAQGRYRWGNEKVLVVLTDNLEQERTRKPHNSKPPSGITFVKEGAKPFRPQEDQAKPLAVSARLGA